MKNWLLWILSTIAVVVIYQLCYGLVTLRPSNINWLMSAHEDWGTHYLGWAYFKSEPWQFPLGKITGYNFPLGTNVGFTDSIPLLAIFFKLFAPFLNGDFQYFGIWLFICHLLAAYFTILLFRLFKVNWIVTVAAVIFIAANPVLIYRGMHPALCGHWFIIAAIYFYFRNPQTTGTKKILLSQFLLLLVSSVVNPYLCWMVLGFSFATSVKLSFFDKTLSWKNLLIYLAVSLFSVWLLWYIVGMVSFGRKEDLWVNGAYGLYSLNLNSLFNSGGFSSFLPQLKQVSWHQYEGYMYLGVGMYILIVILLSNNLLDFFGRRFKKTSSPKKITNRNRYLYPLYALVALYTIFSITLVFTWNEKVLFKIPAPGFFIQLEEIFRASARFFWMPYYLIILFAIIGISKSRINSIVSSALIVVALVIQLYDIKPILTFRHLPSGTYSPPMDDRNWICIMKQFQEIIFFPAFQSPNIRPMDYQDFAYLALKAGKPVNLAYVARANSRSMKKYADSLTAKIEDGKLSSQALYITNSVNLEHFSLALQSNTTRLNTLDSCYYIFSGEPENHQLLTLTNKLNAPKGRVLDSILTAIKFKTEFKETNKIILADNKTIRYVIQSLNIGQKVISAEGWAFIDSIQNNKGDSIFITLSNGDTSYMAEAKIIQRPDVTANFKKTYLDDSGFKFFGFTDQVRNGKYKIGLAIKDAQGRFVFQPTENVLVVGIP
jgi:hypothetical protein